jgi:hypothetical protein
MAYLRQNLQKKHDPVGEVTEVQALEIAIFG